MQLLLNDETKSKIKEERRKKKPDGDVVLQTEGLLVDQRINSEQLSTAPIPDIECVTNSRATDNGFTFVGYAIE